MANNSRSEVKIDATSTFVATLDLADHVAHIKDVLEEGAIYKKDDIGTQTASASSTTVSFASYDTMRLASAGYDLSLTISNVENGQMVALRITGKSAKTVAFVNVTDITPNQDYVTAQSEITYLIFNKDATMFGMALIDAITPSTDPQIRKKVLDIGFWDMNISAAGTANPTAGSISHSITNALTKVVSISCIIYYDSGAIYEAFSPDGSGNLGIVCTLDATNVNLTTFAGNKFDGLLFNDPAINRGKITILYEI